MNDKKHGKGKYHCPDGSRYYGNFASDMRHGYGEYFFENKLVYSGEWKNDRK